MPTEQTLYGRLPAALMLLKATTKKQVWVPQFTKKNGQVVGGHFAHVHVTDDHDHKKVAAGQGSYSQKKAHAQLVDEPAFHALDDTDKAALVMHHATQIQDAESQAARLATLKKKLLAGEKPSPGEWKHFHAAAPEKQQAITEAVHAAGHGAHMDSLYADYVAKQPPANEKPAEAEPAPAPAPKQEAAPAIKPLDHGELNIPGKTNNIDAQLDKYKKEQAAQAKTAAKQATASKKEAKAEAKAIFEQHGDLIAETMAAKMGKPKKEITAVLDDFVKWQPNKMLALWDKFQKENPQLVGSEQAPAPKEEPKAAPEPEKAPAPAAAAPTGLAMPEFTDGKTTTGVKDYYEKVGQKIIDLANAGDVAALESMPNPEKGNSWKGKTPNSKALLGLHAAALAHAKGEKPAAPAAAPAAAAEPSKGMSNEKYVSILNAMSDAKSEKEAKAAYHAYIDAGGTTGDAKMAQKQALGHLFEAGWGDLSEKLGAEAAPAAEAPEAAPVDAKKKAQLELIDKLGAAGHAAMIGSKGVVLANSAGYPKTYANQTQASNAAQKLLDSGFDCEVIGMHPYLVKVHSFQSYLVKQEGPKEGDTKAGKGGTLVLKDGHWVLQAEGTPAMAYLIDAINGTATVQEAMKEWAVAHPDQQAELHDALVTLGFDGYAKEYEPKAPAPAPASDGLDDEAVMAFAEKLQNAALDDSNVNAKSFNAKLQAIHDAFNANDTQALLAMSYGTNTYGKKAAKLANEALAILGTRHQVEPGQKAGAHPKIKVVGIKKTEPAAAPAPAAPAAAPAPAVAGPVPPAMEGLNGSAQEAVKTAQEAFAAGDLAKLEILDASTSGLYSFNSTNAYIKECIAHLQAGDKQQALIDGWKAAISSGMVPSKEQAEAMDALAQSDPDQHLEHTAETHGELAMVMNLDVEWDTDAPEKAKAKQEELHKQALSGAAPAKAVGLDDAAVAALHMGGADYEKAAKAKQLAKVGDLAALEAYVVELHHDGWPSTAAYAAALATLLEKKQGAAPSADGPVDPAVVKAAYGAKNIPALQTLMLQAVKAGQKQMGDDISKMIQNINAGIEDGPKDGDTKQGADGMLVFENGRWHKMGTDPKVLKQKAASVPMPKLKGTNSIKLTKVMKAIKEAAETGGAEALGKIVKLTPGGHVKALGFNSINPEGSKYGEAATAFAKYAKAMIQAMEGTKGSDAPSAAPAAPKAATTASSAPAASSKPSMKVSKTEKVGKITAMIADGWEQTGPQKGSNPGGKFKDAKGQEWYCKFPSDPATVQNELLAAKFYQMLGSNVPELRLVKKDGKLGIASKWTDGVKQGTSADLAKAEGAHDAFVFDAWLANWDVVGLSNDNLLLDKAGKAMRIDVGGSLLFRAQGGPKGDAFGESVPELETLLDPAKNSQSAAVFAGITPEHLQKGAETLAKMHPHQISKLCRTFGPGTRAENEALAAKLVARREFILKKMGVTDPWNAPPPDLTKIKVNPADLPTPIDFNNYPGKGGGLSSKAHVNNQNTIDDAALIAFAKQGNLKALQDYHYDAYDKETGAYIGKKPISVHPSKDIKNHWGSLCDLLSSLAHPPVEGLDMPPLGGGSVEEVSEQAGYVKPGETISTISSDKVVGFWMKLGHVGAEAVAELMPQKNFFLKKDAIQKAKKWWGGVPAHVQKLMSMIIGSGSNNHYWSQGAKTIPMANGALGVQTAAMQCYEAAVEMEEGVELGRWMGMSQQMKDQILKEGPGMVFQNTDSMCTSMIKDWDNSSYGSGFGNTAFLRIRCAKGAKMLLTHGKPSYSYPTSSFDAEGHALGSGSAEEEITTLMGQRFVVLKVEKGNKKNANGITIELLALPPHDGYLAELSSMAQMGKSFSQATAALRKSVVVFVKPFAKK